MGQAIPIMPKFWSVPPLFLEDEDIFQKWARVVPILYQFPKNHASRFLKNVLIFEKKGGC